MKDNGLDKFINDLLLEDIENSKFEHYIDMFSKFLGYVNADYKYNGTYLRQYIDDYIKVCMMLKKKKEKYNEIWMEMINIRQKFELFIDRTFHIKFFLEDNGKLLEGKGEYVGIDKNIITSNFIEVKIIIYLNKEEYTFCKTYDNIEERLSERVYADVEKFLTMKKRRVRNETS